MNKRQFDTKFFNGFKNFKREKNDAQIKHEEKIFGHVKTNLKDKTATKKEADKDGEATGPPNRVLP